MFAVRNFYATCKQGLKYQKVAQRLGVQRLGVLPLDSSTFLYYSDTSLISKKRGMFLNKLIRLRYLLSFLYLKVQIVQNYITSIFEFAFLSLLIAISDILSLKHSLMMLKKFFEKYGAAILQYSLGGTNPSYVTAW